MSEKKYVIDNEFLMSRWDYEKNNAEGIYPDKLSQGSHSKANFICNACRNKYFTVIRDVIKYNGGCPECTKRRRIESINKTMLLNKETLFDTNPELASEWDYEKNNEIGLFPKKVLSNSNKKAFWICPVGHSYLACISNRTSKNTGCKYCAGQAVLKGYNDLATTRADLLKEWDYEKNNEIGIYPDQVMRGSHKIANWICPIGHNYKKEIKLRTAGQGCPECTKGSQTSFPEQAIYFYLSQIFKNVENRYGKPEIDIFVHDINFGIEYDGAFSHKDKEAKEMQKDKIIESKGINLLRIKETNHEIKDSDKIIYCIPNGNNSFLNDVIKKIIRITNERYNLNNDIDIDIHRDRIKIEEQYMIGLVENSIANLYPQFVKEWDYNKNGNIKPEYVSWGSKKKYYWICDNYHSYESSPYDRVRGFNCTICCGRQLIKGENDLQTKYPELLRFWDYEKNINNPDSIKYTSSKKFWWKCDKGHSYLSTIESIKKYKGCIACKTNNNELSDYSIRYGLMKGENDLLTVNPELASEWDYEKNELLPEDYLFCSNKSVWWKCKKCKNSWIAVINQRKNCPQCKKINITYNIYNIENGELIGTFVGLKSICEKLNLDYNKKKSNISEVSNRNQKTIENKYLIRKINDDEFSKYEQDDRQKKIVEYLKK